MRYLLGLDDTDSKFGHCTTHLGYLIVCELQRIGCRIPAYPRLVRLNPNVPFKTRGNAAVCVEFEASETLAEAAFLAAERLLESEADVANGANSALLMVRGDSDPKYFRQLYLSAISGVVSYRRVLREVSRMEVKLKVLGNGMGVVGAAASLGFSQADDHTYELIAYRRPENCGTQRSVDPVSVARMEKETFTHTFNSFDHGSGRVLVAPKGPDPVLVGVRGDSPTAVIGAFRSLKVGEGPLGHMVYATNQCTDAHLTEELQLPLKAYSSGWLHGKVVLARTERGSHIVLGLDVRGRTVKCMVYEPSGDLRFMARLLKSGDEVAVFGGVRRGSSRNPPVLNVEKIEVNSAAGVARGSYLPSPRAQRHLTKQLIRYGREQNGAVALVNGWVDPPHKAPSRASASEATIAITAA